MCRSNLSYYQQGQPELLQKETKAEQRGLNALKKNHNTAEFVVTWSWIGILENCPDIHHYKEDINVVLYPSADLSVRPLPSHLRSSEVKGHPAKALLPFPRSLNPFFHTPACLTWGFSVTPAVFSGGTTAQGDTRSDWVRRQDSKIETSDTQNRVVRRWLCEIISNLFTVINIKKQPPAVVLLEINGPLGSCGAADFRLTTS